MLNGSAMRDRLANHLKHISEQLTVTPSGQSQDANQPAIKQYLQQAIHEQRLS